MRYAPLHLVSGAQMASPDLLTAWERSRTDVLGFVPTNRWCQTKNRHSVTDNVESKPKTPDYHGVTAADQALLLLTRCVESSRRAQHVAWPLVPFEIKVKFTMAITCFRFGVLGNLFDGINLFNKKL